MTLTQRQMELLLALIKAAKYDLDIAQEMIELRGLILAQLKSEKFHEPTIAQPAN